MDLFKALLVTQISWLWPELDKFLSSWWLGLGWSQGCSLFVTCAIMSHSWHLARAFLRGHNKHSQPQIITAGVILTRVHCTFIAHAVLQVAGVTVYSGRHSHLKYILENLLSSCVFWSFLALANLACTTCSNVLLLILISTNLLLLVQQASGLTYLSPTMIN